MGKNSVVPRFRPAALSGVGGARPSVRPAPPKRARASEMPLPPETIAEEHRPTGEVEPIEEIDEPLALDTQDVVAVTEAEPELPSFEADAFRHPSVLHRETRETPAEIETQVARPAASEPATPRRASLPEPTTPRRASIPPPTAPRRTRSAPPSITPDEVTLARPSRRELDLEEDVADEATLFRRPELDPATFARREPVLDPATLARREEADERTLARERLETDERTLARDRLEVDERTFARERPDTDERTVARPATADERALYASSRRHHDDVLPPTYPADLNVPYDALPSLEVESPYFPGAADRAEAADTADTADAPTRADVESYVAPGKSAPPMMHDSAAPRSGPRSLPRSESFQAPVPAFDDESGSHDTHDPSFDMRGGAGWGTDDFRAADPRRVGTLKSPAIDDFHKLDPRRVGTLKSPGAPLPPPASVPSVVIAQPAMPAGFVVGVQPVKVAATSPMPATMPMPPYAPAPMHGAQAMPVGPSAPPTALPPNATMMTSRSVVERRLTAAKAARIAWFAGGIGFGVVVMLLAMNALRPAAPPAAPVASTAAPTTSTVPLAGPAAQVGQMAPAQMPAVPPAAYVAEATAVPPPVIISPPVTPVAAPAIPVTALAEPAPAPAPAPKPAARAPAPAPRHAPRKPAPATEAAPAPKAAPAAAPKSNPNELQDLLNQALAP